MYKDIKVIPCNLPYIHIIYVWVWVYLCPLDVYTIRVWRWAYACLLHVYMWVSVCVCIPLKCIYDLCVSVGICISLHVYLICECGYMHALTCMYDLCVYMHALTCIYVYKYGYMHFPYMYIWSVYEWVYPCPYMYIWSVCECGCMRALTCIYDLCVSVGIWYPNTYVEDKKNFKESVICFHYGTKGWNSDCQGYMVRSFTHWAILPTQNIQVSKNCHWLQIVPEISRYSVQKLEMYC